MKGHWILWTGLVILGACSLSRHRHTEARHTAQLEAHAMLSQRDAHRDTLVRRSGQSVRHLREVAVFKPVGTVAYHPDSGLRGQVSEVWIYRARTEMADSQYHAQGSGAHGLTEQQTRVGHTETATRSEVGVSRRTPRPMWWIPLAAAVAACLWLLRWICRRWF